MGRNPLCHEKGLKKGSWSPHEDIILVNYINQHGLSTWNTLSKNAGLQRSGKSCRLRWTNYLRPDVNHGSFTLQEKNRVIELQAALGNRWSAIASHLPGRTDNEIKNVWNTHLMKQLVTMDLDPQTHESSYTPYGLSIYPPTSYSKNHVGQWENVKFETEPCSPSASDYFLELWNSEVGESFRKVIKKENPEDSTTCQNPRPPSKSHTAQWESARLEAESRLLSGSKMYSPHASSSDYFLQLWNSEVGDSFRKVKKIENRENSRSRVSEALSFTKYASKSSLTFDTWQASKSASNQGKELWLKEDSKPQTSVLNARVDTCQSSKSATNRDEEIGFKEYSRPQIVVQHARSDSCSNEADKSSVSCLQLLLDIHPNNDTRLSEEDDMNGYWWSAIATKLPGTSDADIDSLWDNHLKKQLGTVNHELASRRRGPSRDKERRNCWSPEEDDLLVKYVNERGPGNWRSLPKTTGLQRSAVSCKCRWIYHLRPAGIKGKPFSPQDKELVMQLYATLGNRWSAIAVLLPGRTEKDIKNLWRNCLKRRLRREKEAAKPGIKRKPFSPQEKKLVMQLHATLGNRWSAIAAQLPERTENEIENLWRTCLRARLQRQTEAVKNSTMYQSLVSQASSSTTYDSNSRITVDTYQSSKSDGKQNEDMDWKEESKSQTVVLNGRSDSCSNELDNSFESTLKLLMDLSENNDMSFLDDLITDNSIYPLEV